MILNQQLTLSKASLLLAVQEKCSSAGEQTHSALTISIPVAPFGRNCAAVGYGRDPSRSDDARTRLRDIFNARQRDCEKTARIFAPSVGSRHPR